MFHISKQIRNLSKIAKNAQKLNLRYKFASQKQRPQKVFLDEESIKKKMQQLKQRSQTLSPNQRNLKKKNKQFMPTFTIPEVNKKINSFRRQNQIEDLFAFSQITLQEKPTQLQITGYDQEFFKVDDFSYPPCIILTPHQVLNWQVQAAQDLKIQDFSILKCIQPIPDYVIIGVPDSLAIKQPLRAKIRQLHDNIDFLDLFEAISQYNTVVNNDKYCMAFMISTTN